jgi:branched-chain amino acid transport system permease protein
VRKVLADRALALHGAVLAALFLIQFVLPDYHHTNVARIMVYAVLAIGYNLLLGYTGLLSLGHAMFFAAGAYGVGLSVHWLGWSPLGALAAGVLAGLLVSALAAIVLMRTTGVAFLIVTLMLAQAFQLTAQYFKDITLGDNGIVIANLPTIAFGLSLADPSVKYNLAWLAFAFALLSSLLLVRSPVGRVLIAIRENEPRARLLGYETAHYRVLAIIASGGLAGLSGALFALLFGFVGTSMASLQYSTLPLLWTLMGGAGATLGPLIGTGFMFYLVDIASSLTSSYLLVVGLTLVALTLWLPKGIAGKLRQGWLTWLP